MNVVVNNLSEDPVRTEAREKCGANIAVFVNNTDEPDVIFNAETPEIEQQYAAMIAGMVLIPLKNKWSNQIYTQGMIDGVRISLRAIRDLLGEDAYNQIRKHLIDLTSAKSE